MSFTELVIAALAVWEIIEIWRHGAIFADWRARVELWEGFFGRLLRCGFCLAPWVAFLLVVPTLAPLPRMTEGVTGVVWFFEAVAMLLIGMHRLAIYAFAVARLANLGNDLTHEYNRTPKEDRLIPQTGNPKNTFEGGHHDDPDRDSGPGPQHDPRRRDL